MYSFNSKESEAANKMLDIKNIWADIWFTPRNQISALFLCPVPGPEQGSIGIGMQAGRRACFFMAADPLGQQRSEPTKTRHFGVVIARKNFLKKVCENLLTLSRWSGIL